MIIRPNMSSQLY